MNSQTNFLFLCRVQLYRARITAAIPKRFLAAAAVLLAVCLLCAGCGGKQKIASAASGEQSVSSAETAADDNSENSQSEGGADSAGPADTPPAGSESGADPSGGSYSGPSTGPSSGPASSAGLVPLKVTGTQLTGADGSPVVLKGVSTHGLSWFPEYVNADSFRQLHSQWGVNCIRLAMYTAEYNGYCTGGAQNQAKLKALIDDGVKYAAQNQMYAIIDWHILSDGNPHTYLEQAKAFFDETAEKYASCDHVLYEICNEPNGGTSWQQIKSYAQQVIPVIRQRDPDAVIIVGTPNWSQYVGQAAADPIAGYDNIMYALHFYAATHTDSLRQEMTAAIQSGLPVIVSEFGICDASGSGSIDQAQAAKWMSLLDQYKVSRIAWNLSNKNETSAMIASGCQKKSGWDYQELSPSGQWLLDNLFHGTSAAGTDTPTAGVPDAPPPAPSISTAPPPSGSGGPLENAPYELTMVNSWETDGKKFSQYALTVRNPQAADCSGWSAVIPFDRPMTLVSGWNGAYAMNGHQLTVRSLDYNGTVPANGQISGVGFIVHD
ncbi:MAG: cellulase family glycosylhydrolase [Clostridiales bacterium]|nr:cellulase family glycosylhydrolase [Clostridiales bacterium]